MPDTLFSIIAANFVVSLVSFAGVAIFIWKKLQSDSTTIFLVSFAAGITLSAAILDLLPEALDLAKEKTDIFLPLLGGIVLFFFLERFLLWFHHHHESHGLAPAPALILLGDAVHNAIDGLAIAATFLVNPAIGLVTTLAIAAHEIPQEIADLSILLYGGYSKRKALLYNFFSGLTAIFGGIAGYFFLNTIQDSIPLFLAFTAGMFIYIACADLIPDLHRDFVKQKNWGQTLAFLLGIAVLWLMTKLVSA